MNKDKEQNLANLKRKANISDLSSFGLNEFKNIQDMVFKNQLSKDEIALLIELVPNFIELQKEFINSIKDATKEAGKNQQAAFTSIDNITRILEKLAENVQSDEARLAIADKVMELSKTLHPIIEKMNSNNNEMYKKFLSVGFVAAVAIGVIYRIFK